MTIDDYNEKGRPAGDGNGLEDIYDTQGENRTEGGGKQALIRQIAEYLAAARGGEVWAFTDFANRVVYQHGVTSFEEFIARHVFGGGFPPCDSSTGLWTLPAVRSYCERVGAKPSSLKRAWVMQGEGRYSRAIAAIDFAEDGTATAPADYAPTAEEQAAIHEQAKNVKLPKQALAPDDDVPDHLEETDPKNLFAFKDARGRVVCWQERREDKDGKRSFHFWTFYDDDRWRLAEPEEGLPLFGLEQLASPSFNGTIYLHEGAKAARAMQNIKSDHPWFDELHGAAHIGWVGGAPNPHRTNWEPLQKANSFTRVVIVPDNDDIGRSAVQKISKQIFVPTYELQFTDEFPVKFDLADDFPKEMFGKKAITVETEGKQKEIRQYVGPRHDSCLVPATWITAVAGYNEKGVPSYKLRKSARGQWVYVQEIDKYASVDKPQLRYKSEALNNALIPFSDALPMRYIKKDYNRQVIGLCYRPDREGLKIVSTEDGPKLNVFRPCSLKPVKGDATPWLRFLEHLLPVEEERYFVKRICATLIARPDVSMKIALLLVSKTQGTGKSTLAKILAMLVGSHNVSEPNADTIVEKEYTDWIVYKRLVIVHEIYEGRSWKAYNKLKSKITEDRTSAVLKYEPSYEVDNFASFVLCSNSYEALKIEDSDRRIYAPKVTETAMSKKEAREFYDWLEAGGYNVIMQWALDFGNYLPSHTDVPTTSVKDEMIDASRSPIEEFVKLVAYQMMSVEDYETGEVKQNEKALIVSVKEVFDAAMAKYPKEYFGANTVKNALISAGLFYLQDKVKINGAYHRLMLNAKAVEEIEARERCRYSPTAFCFARKMDADSNKVMDADSKVMEEDRVNVAKGVISGDLSKRIRQIYAGQGREVEAILAVKI